MTFGRQVCVQVKACSSSFDARTGRSVTSRQLSHKMPRRKAVHNELPARVTQTGALVAIQL